MSTKTSRLQNHLSWVLDQAHDLAVAHVRSQATALLLKHGNLTAFCLAMGTVCFYTKRGPLDPKPYTKELIDFVDDLDRDLHLTGAAVKLTKNPDGSVTFTDTW